jgi:hypothetical protein
MGRKAGDESSKSPRDLPGQSDSRLDPVKKIVTYFTSGASRCGDRLVKTETESDLMREHQRRRSAKGVAAKEKKAVLAGKRQFTAAQVVQIEASRAAHGENHNQIALDVFYPGPNKPKVAKGTYRKRVATYLSANPR